MASKKKIFLSLGLMLALFASLLLVRTFRFNSKQVNVKPIQPIAIDEGAVAARLAQAIRFQTVSYQDEKQVRGEEFLAFHKYLEEIFPKVHATLTKELVGGYSLLYKWQGRNETLQPILLMAHQDVVPVETDSLGNWEHPPFDGLITDGYIWGRGAMDDKSALVSIMEAVEMFLHQGFQPERTIYLAFGHDEEVGGDKGAAQIAQLLKQRNVEFEYILDEGLAITEGVVPDFPWPLAVIGIAEKGYLSLELSVKLDGGHSSMPQPQTAIGVLSAAISRLESQQMPARLEGAQRKTFEYIGPELPFAKKLLMANLWLFRPIVERSLASTPATNASIRTTTAATIIDGGLKENVLPTEARAVVNFRLLPGDTSDQVISHVTRAINDSRVKVNRFGTSNIEASSVSNIKAPGFRKIELTLRQLYPELRVAPGLVLGGTDAKHYAALSNNIYRFAPIRLRPEDMSRLHGLNERVSVKDYAASVRFYYQLIRHSDGVWIFREL